jgi:hypothetical protein
MRDVVALLDDLGFDLERAYPAHGSFDSQHDCVFMRRDSMSREILAIRDVYGL